MSVTVEWLGHASFRIRRDRVMYIDPWKVSGDPPADIILISHEHHDHCDASTVKRLTSPGTLIVGNAASIDKLEEGGIRGDLRSLKPGEQVEAEGVVVKAVPAYNVNKYRSPGVHYHPKSEGHLGYLIHIDDEVIYYTGDTDFIPEMSEISCDVLLLPVSGKYVMTAEEAVEAARTIQPRKYAVPMHYGAIVGTVDDAKRFQALYKGEVRVLDKKS